MKYLGLTAYDGFRIETCIHAYRTFVRPIAEYALAILPKLFKYQQSIIDKMQYKSLLALLSLPHATSHMRLLAVTGLPSMTQRVQALRHRFAYRFRGLLIEQEETEEDFMVVRAIKSEPTSYIRKLWNDGIFEEKEHSLHEQLMIIRANDLQQSFDFLCKDMLTRVQVEPKRVQRCLQFFRYRNRLPQSVTYLLLCWLMRKIPRQPRKCNKCNKERAHYIHMIQCCDLTMKLRRCLGNVCTIADFDIAILDMREACNASCYIVAYLLNWAAKMCFGADYLGSFRPHIEFDTGA